MSADPRIRSGHSCAADPRQAVEELHAQLAGPDTELVLFFCSSGYELERLAAEINRRFAGLRVLGCTTAGEIGPAGYRQFSLSGMSLPKGGCTAVAGRIDGLQDFEIGAGARFAQDLLSELEGRAPRADGRNSFALLLIDGLSMREEPVARTLQHALGDIVLFGGSAGDDLKFERTQVFHDGAFHTDSAVLAIVSTRYPFKVFKNQHFVCDEERLVVTEADTAHRIVREINGLPAAEEYARIIGLDVSALDPEHFAAAPVVVLIDGTDYVRSIQKANPDGSLTFYCAIDEGVVLRVAHGENLIANLERLIADLEGEVGPLQAVLACDCILRNLEISQRGLRERVGEILRAHHVVGFSTYGEQYRGVHVNQTITGIAIGVAPADDARHG